MISFMKKFCYNREALTFIDG